MGGYDVLFNVYFCIDCSEKIRLCYYQVRYEYVMVKKIINYEKKYLL